MKKSAKVIVLSVLGLVALLFLLIIRDIDRINSTNRFIGLAEQIEQTNPIPGEWQQVKDRWSNGDFPGVINKGLHTSWVTIDFGVRTIISQLYFRQSATLESQGQFKQAFDVCSAGAQVIFKYDFRDYVMGAWCVPIAFQHNVINSNTIFYLSPDGTPAIKP